MLRQIAPCEPGYLSGEAYRGRSKLRCLFGDDLFELVKGKVVIDFGCGEGHEAIELARNGARKVIGIDIRESTLERARARQKPASKPSAISNESPTRLPIWSSR